MEINIRKALLADLPELNELIPQSVRKLSAGYYTTSQIEASIQDIFGVDTQLISDGTYYVVEVAGEVGGCGGWSKRKTLYGGDQLTSIREDDELDPTLDPARIRAFFVHPKWARRGLGRRILEKCEEDASASGFNTLELVATLPGEPFYRKLGFVETRRLDVPLSNGDAIECASMRKSITSILPPSD